MTRSRDLSKGRFSLRRLDEICAALGLTLADLLEPPEEQDLVTELSEAQELALISQPKYFVVTYLLVNDWKFREITAAFRMDENELIGILLRLDQLKIIEYRPPHRVRKLTARNFAWRKDGPVHSFFVTRFAPEFFQSAFDGAGDAFGSWAVRCRPGRCRSSRPRSSAWRSSSRSWRGAMRGCRWRSATAAAPFSR